MPNGFPRGPRPAPRRGLHVVVAAVGTAVALALLLALLALAWSEREATRERVREHTVLMARVFAEQAGRNIDVAALAAGTIGERLAGGADAEGPEVQAALMQTLVNLPFVRGMAVVDESGRVLTSADARDRGRRVDLRQLGPLPAPGASTLAPFVAGRRLADLDPATPEAVPPGVGFVPLLRSVQLPTGRRAGVVLLLNIDAFANFQQVTLGDARLAAALLTYDGALVAATAGVALPPATRLAGLPPFERFLPAQESGSWQGPGLRPGPQIGSFRLAQLWPLLAVVEFDQAGADAMWWAETRGHLGVGSALVVLTLVLTAVATRSVRDRQRAQAEVVARERELRETLAGLEELVFRCDGEGRLRFVNGAWLRLLGGDLAHWQGRRLAAVVAPAQAEALVRLSDPALSPVGGSARFELPAQDGRLRSFALSLRPLGDEGFAGSAVDITEQLLAQRQLQGQLAFTEMLLESSPLPMSVLGRDGLYRTVNRAWEQFCGRSRAQVVGRPIGEHLPAAMRPEHEQRDAEVYATGRPMRYEARLPHADGSMRDAVVEKRALPGLDGELNGILVVIIDVTEFRTAERATREARDAAEEASRAKTEFIANISHELRTPLQSIIGFSELGLRRSGGQARLEAMFGDIHSAGHRMLALVNDLLDVSRIEGSSATLQLERADLREPVREVLAELQPLAAQRRLQLDDRLPALPMMAKIDPLRLQQVLRNVVANAIRFSPEGGCVEVAGDRTEAGEWRLSVADRGPGVPPAELERIFEAFVQSSRTKDGSGGTGLGLAISRALVQAHGGHIVARNRDGGGALFEIVLPNMRAF